MSKKSKKIVIAILYCVIVLILSAVIFYISLNKRPDKNSDASNTSSVSQEIKVDFYKALNAGDSKVVAEFFADDICEILVTEFVTIKPTEYKLNSKEKLEEALQILSESYYGQEVSEFAIEDFESDMKFEFKDTKETKTTLEMDFWIESGVIKLTSGEKTKFFLFPEKSYVNLRSLPTERFYLHNSNLKPPSDMVCKKAKNEFLSGLSDDEKKAVSTKIRSLHDKVENILLNNIPYLKEVDSKYWNFVITGLTEDAPTVTGQEFGELGLNGCINKIDELSKSVTNQKAVDNFEKLYDDLKKACDSKNLQGILKVHEVIHDYDYFAVNYPVRYNYEAADWGGLDDYFGNID